MHPPRGSDMEIAWAGGLFEGEGSFTFSSSGARTPRIYKTAVATISMCDIEPLQRFRDAVGLGSIYGPYQNPRPNHRESWRWTIRGKNGVIALLALLEPFLTDRRVGRAIEVILMDTSGRSRLPKWTTIPGRELRSSLPVQCPHGHLYDVPNTYITPAGGYQCRTCKRERERQRAAAMKTNARYEG